MLKETKAPRGNSGMQACEEHANSNPLCCEGKVHQVHHTKCYLDWKHIQITFRIPEFLISDVYDHITPPHCCVLESDRAILTLFPSSLCTSLRLSESVSPGLSFLSGHRALFCYCICEACLCIFHFRFYFILLYFLWYICFPPFQILIETQKCDL